MPPRPRRQRPRAYLSRGEYLRRMRQPVTYSVDTRAYFRRMRQHQVYKRAMHRLRRQAVLALRRSPYLPPEMIRMIASFYHGE